MFRCAKSSDDVGSFVLSESLGDPCLPYGRDVKHLHRVQPLSRDLADAGSAGVGLVVAPEPRSAPAVTAPAPFASTPPL